MNGDAKSYSGQAAMVGIGENTINRWRNDETKVQIERKDWGKDFVSILKNSSSVWHHETYQGEGTLLEKFRNPFNSTMGGSPSATSCSALLFSWVTAQNIISLYYGAQHPPAYQVNVVYQPAVGTVFFKSNTGSLPSTSDYERQFLVNIEGLLSFSRRLV